MTKLAISKARSLFLVTIFLIPGTLLATQLHVLVRANDVTAVRDYISGTPRAMFEINMRDDQGETPLQIAQSLGNSEMAKVLIEHGARKDEAVSNSPFRRKSHYYSTEYSRSVGATSAASAATSMPSEFPAPAAADFQAAVPEGPTFASQSGDDGDAPSDDNANAAKDAGAEPLFFDFDD